MKKKLTKPNIYISSVNLHKLNFSNQNKEQQFSKKKLKWHYIDRYYQKFAKMRIPDKRNTQNIKTKFHCQNIGAVKRSRFFHYLLI